MTNQEKAKRLIESLTKILIFAERWGKACQEYTLREDETTYETMNVICLPRGGYQHKYFADDVSRIFKDKILDKIISEELELDRLGRCSRETPYKKGFCILEEAADRLCDICANCILTTKAIAIDLGFATKEELKHLNQYWMWMKTKDARDYENFRFLIERAKLLLEDQETPVKIERAEAKHSDDFSSVIWYGIKYPIFNKTQALVVGLLWKEWEKGTPTLSDSTIKKVIGSANERFRLRHTFRNHPAFGTMIKSNGKGIYQLSPPESPQITT
jgi:hypothetical protein